MSDPHGDAAESTSAFSVSDACEAADVLHDRLGRDGYLYFRSLLPLPLIEAMALRVRTAAEPLRILDRTRIPLTYRDPDFIALQQQILSSPELAQLAATPPLLEVLNKALRAPPQRRYADICRVAAPLADREPSHRDPTTPPHQDAHYLRTPDPHFLISWIPLVEVPLELGPLALLVGSPARGLIPHVYRERSDAHEASLAVEDREQCWATGALRRGDVLIFTALTVHRSLPNRSQDAFRLSIDLRWSAEPAADSQLEAVLNDHGI